ncbi:MAG TPA: arylsulfatase [Verrucomicrobiae bacterium]|nr:arylsulfatase [Verrucomicrobiae bacterium]
MKFPSSLKFLTVLSAASVASLVSAGPPPAQKPDVVYILCDDLGYGDVHCFNPDRCKIETPNMDRLRSQGMAFTDCHAVSSLCTPSRYGILTGRYSWRTRLQHGVLGGESPPLIEPGRLTVAGLLQENGYMTAGIGKWHLGLQFNTNDYSQPIVDGPLQHGFDYYLGLSASLDIPPYDYFENDHWTEVPSARKAFPSFVYGTLNSGPGPVRMGRAAPDFEAESVLPNFTRKAIDYIRQRGADKKPFFLYLALPSPHTPLVPEKQWQGRSSIGPYGDYVMETDWAVGQVVDAIDSAGLHDNTVVMMASDNGCAPNVGVHKFEAVGHYPSAQFRGYKTDIWDGGHRIPFLVRWPAKIKPGGRSDQIIGLWDLMATCAEILHVKLPPNAGEDSVSLLPAFLGNVSEPLHADNAIVNQAGGNGRFAIRQGNWKLELCPGSGGGGRPRDADALRKGLPPIQLYNMHDDVGERVNIEASNGQLVTNLVKLLEKYVADGRTTPGPRQPNDVPVHIWMTNQVGRVKSARVVPKHGTMVSDNVSPYGDPPANDPTYGN